MASLFPVMRAPSPMSIFESKLDAKAVQRQLADFAAAWHESRELREFLLDPSSPWSRKSRCSTS